MCYNMVYGEGFSFLVFSHEIEVFNDTSFFTFSLYFKNTSQIGITKN